MRARRRTRQDSLLRRRGGFSILEVLLATAIFLGCVIVLGELAAIGREHAVASQEYATAQRLAENKLNEILSGAAPMEPLDAEPADEEGWLVSVAIESIGQSGLVALRITASRDPAVARRTREFLLVRWVPRFGSVTESAPADDVEPAPEMPDFPTSEAGALP